MGRYCMVETCKSEYYPDCMLSFHRLPKTNPMREKWLNVIPSGSRKITHNSVICSKHFKPEDYVSYLERPALKENTVPSLFLFPASIKNQLISEIELSAGRSKFQEVLILLEPPTTEESKDVCVRTLKKEECEELNSKVKVEIELSPVSSEYQDVHIPTEPPTKELKDVSVQTQKTEDIEKLRRKVRLLTKKLRRRNCRIQNLKTLLSVLKTKCNHFNEVQMMIKTNKQR